MPRQSLAAVTSAIDSLLAGAVDPQSMPAGLYAKAWLKGQGLWTKVIDRVIPTENVRATLAAVASGRSVGTPGLLRMLEQAHAQHGKLPWARLFEPDAPFPPSYACNLERVSCGQQGPLGNIPKCN